MTAAKPKVLFFYYTYSQNFTDWLPGLIGILGRFGLSLPIARRSQEDSA
jgi:hypothetical protein